jgi:outer membrane receptor for ferric coprogen and ferric-rhodotorulic acid
MLVLTRRIGFSAALAVILALAGLPLAHAAATPAAKAFDLPSDSAAVSLRQFASQSGLDVVFATEATANVRTNAVKGTFVPGDAINRLLAGTGLIAEQNPRTGALTILRSPNDPRVAQARTSDRPANSSESNASAAAGARSNASASSRSTAGDGTVLLSPFEVRTDKDTGYIATNTLAGSRLNTRLADTPASISVMTKDFLNDIGALNVSQAMEYALSASNDIGGGGVQLGASTGNGLIENDFNFQIRGYRRATQTRDFFPTLLDADSFNIDRVEVARGPNSLLFGIGGPGGIVNTTPKRADPNASFGELILRVGSWGRHRVAFDVNRELVKGKLGARANVLFQRADGFHDFESDDQDRGALTLTWRPTNSTTVRAGGELGRLHQNRVRPWSAGNNYGKWQANGSRMFAFGTPESPAGTLAPNPSTVIDENYSQQFTSAGTGAPVNGLPARTDRDGIPGIEQRTAQTGTYNLFMDGPLAGKTLFLGTRAQGARYYRTSTGYGNAAGFNTPFPITDESVYPHRANIAGPGQFVEIDYHTFGVAVEQRIGQSLFLEAAVNRTTRQFLNRSVLGFSSISVQYDATSQLPTFRSDFTYNATPGGPTTTGQGLGALNFAQLVPNPLAGQMLVLYNPSYYKHENTLDDARVSASYRLNLGWAGDHTLLGFVSRAESEVDRRDFATGNVDPARATTNQFTNIPVRVRHVDVFSSNLADRGIPDPWNDPVPASNVIYGAPNERFTPGFLPSGRSHSRVRIDSAAVAAHSAFFKRNLITTFGGRRDRIRVYNDGPVIRDVPTQVVTGITPATRAAVDQSGNTYSVGAVLHVPWVRGVSIFGNKSTNFRDQSGAQRFEDEALRPSREIGPLEGEGRDYGLKFGFLDGRLNATVTRFEVAQTNAAVGFDGNVGSYINAIWTTIQNNGPNTLQTDAQNPQGHHVGGSDTRAQKSTGWELELTANPTRGWRVSFNISKSENVVSGLGENVGAYLQKHRAEWQARSALNYNTSAAPGFLTNSGGTNTIGALVTGLDGILAFTKSGENQTEVNIRPWNANVFTAYRFTEGFLKNLTLGGGVNHRGKAIVGVKAPTSPTDPDQRVQIFKGNAYYLVNGMIGYDLKPRDKIRLRFQLNVENLLDNDELQVLASNYGISQPPLNTGTINKWYYHLEPRRYSLSMTVGF